MIRSYRGWVHRYTRNLKKVREKGIVQRNTEGGEEEQNTGGAHKDGDIR